MAMPVIMIATPTTTSAFAQRLSWPSPSAISPTPASRIVLALVKTGLGCWFVFGPEEALKHTNPDHISVVDNASPGYHQPGLHTSALPRFITLSARAGRLALTFRGDRLGECGKWSRTLVGSVERRGQVGVGANALQIEA
jgi:hypothetical protein